MLILPYITIFKDLYFFLLDKLWQKDTYFRKELNQLRRKVYLMDDSVISLCLSVFDWAKFRSSKGAVKLQTVLDYDSCLSLCRLKTEKSMRTSVRATTVFQRKLCSSAPWLCGLQLTRGFA